VKPSAVSVAVSAVVLVVATVVEPLFHHLVMPSTTG
jgi:hypothetical protein